jgi:hypothetical protein
MELNALLRDSLAGLMRELVDGPEGDLAFITNVGDPGFIRSLARLSAADASLRPGGRSSVAGHVQHVRYGFELMNRWIRGDANAFADATFAQSWGTQQVSDAEWTALVAALERETRDWMHALAEPREWDAVSLSGAISSIAHLAYHIGAIRQLAPASAGPAAKD